MSANDSVLSGIRVIDCATFVAAPASATIMADFGAEVIKIERPPEGDLWRVFPDIPGYPKSELNYTWNLTSRSKRSVGLDLSKEAAREALLRLVARADVFITNYQPAQLRKFRLTWEDLFPVNKRLVYAVVSGYGERGDEAESPAFDALAYWARTGLMTSVTGMDGTPSSPRPAMGDNATATTLFAAVMLGLYRRERTGIGSKVTTSLMAAGAWSNSVEIQAKLFGAEFPVRKPGERPPNPLIAGYASSDGKAMLVISLDPDREFPRICQAIGEPDLAANPLFSTESARRQNAAALHAILQSQFESRPLSEWRVIFRQYDVKWSALPTLDEAVRDPQMRDCGAIVNYEYPGHDHLETVDSPIWVAGTAKRKPEVAPQFATYTRTALREAGYSESEIEQLVRSGAVIVR